MMKKVPKRRFKGFLNAGDWEQRKLGECIDSFEYGLNAAAMEYDGKHKYIRITDIDDETHTFIQDNLTSPAVDFNGSTSNYRLKMGDIVFARTGASVGKTYLYNPNDGELYYAGFLIKGAVIEDCDAGFIYQNTLRKKYDSFIKITSQRSGQPGVNSKEYASFKLNIPSKCEQEKISSLLSALDNLVTLHQRKLEKLQATKKALLYELFPIENSRRPKRRFKGFTDDWEQRKLSKLATMNARIGWQNLRTSEFLDSGDYLLITGTDFDNGRIKYSTCHYVEKKRFDQDTKIQLSTGSILITKDGTLGKVALVEELPKPATLNAGVFNVRVKDDAFLSYKYLYHYLKAPFLMKYVIANATGGTIKHLNQSILVDFPIPITEKHEQDKIAKLLDSLESIITLHQRKLEKLKNLKAAYLNEMFV